MVQELSQPSVVVIDDDRPIVEVVCDVLDEDGIPTSSCPYGEQAQACIRRKQPNLVILDIQMPGVDGIELFLRLRADPATAALPVIFLTANSHILRQRLPAYQRMGAALLPKPFDIEKLRDLVARMLAT